MLESIETIPKKNIDNLVRLLKALIKSSYQDGYFSLELEEPLINFDEEIRKVKEILNNYDLEVVYEYLDYAIRETGGAIDNIDENFILEILKGLLQAFKNNLTDHLLVIPLPELKIKEKISFGDYSFLPYLMLENEKKRIISKMANTNLKQLRSAFDHTTRSRTKDFFKFPLLCFNVKNHPGFITRNTPSILKLHVYLLRCLYYGEIENKLNLNSIDGLLQPIDQLALDTNRFIAVYGDESWKMNHFPLNFDTACKFSLDWLNTKKYQQRYISLISLHFGNLEHDDFLEMFNNALMLFNKALEYYFDGEYSVSLILTFTALESILTRDRNEKNLRLSALLPRLVNLQKNVIPDIVKKLRKLYISRNDFVHAGLLVETSMKDYNQMKEDIKLCLKLLAALILKYDEFALELKKEIKSKEFGKKERLNNWIKNLDAKFQNILESA